MSVAAGSCWPDEQDAGCAPLLVCTSAEHKLRCPCHCPSPVGHNARHHAVRSRDRSFTVTSSDRRRNQNCARQSGRPVYCQSLDQRRTFFHSLFQDSAVIGASVAPAAQNSRVRHVFVSVWGESMDCGVDVPSSGVAV